MKQLNNKTKYICPDCFEHEYFKNWVKKESKKDSICSYCGKKNPCVEFNHFLKKLNKGIKTYYSKTKEENIFKDEDGDYFVDVWETSDLIEEELEGEICFKNKSLKNDVKKAIGKETWCLKDPLGLNHGEKEKYSWEHFCELVKYENRYCFFTESTDETKETLAPVEILRIIASKIEKLNIIKTLPENTDLYRVRAFKTRKDKVLDAKNLGSPEPIYAKGGRMNAYGISVFYASETLETAVREICDESSKNIAAGVFQNIKKLKYLDLTSLGDLDAPNLFDIERKEERQTILFLKFLHKALTKKIVPTGKTAKEVEYVPTQIFSEYVKYSMKLEGIKYNSAKDKNGVCMVLFFNQNQCIENKNPLLNYLGRQKLKLVKVIDFKRKDKIREILKRGL